jgi:hypothetical protein
VYVPFSRGWKLREKELTRRAEAICSRPKLRVKEYVSEWHYLAQIRTFGLLKLDTNSRVVVCQCLLKILYTFKSDLRHSPLTVISS